MTDQQFAESKEHQVAMAARSFISGLSDLCDLAETSDGAELVQRELGDLVLSHARLGQLVCLVALLKAV